MSAALGVIGLAVVVAVVIFYFIQRRRVVPEWANFFSARQWADFQRLVRDHFRRQNKRCQIQDGVVVVPEEADSAEKYGLSNLAQHCGHAPRDQWESIIEGHFHVLDKGRTELSELENKAKDFSQVSHMLAVRIWPREYADQIGLSNLVCREDLEGTVTTLVLDLPSSIRNVQPDEAKSWDKNYHDLFDLGLENVWKNCQPERREETIPPGVRVMFLTSDNFFVASHALLLERHPQLIGRYGSLVAIPHRHILICHPIENANVVEAVNHLIFFAHGMEKEGPGSISPFLYWYRDGQFRTLPYVLNPDKKAIEFTPPDEFVQLLNEVCAAGEQPGG